MGGISGRLFRAPALAAAAAAACVAAGPARAAPSLDQILSYPFVSDLVSSPKAGRIAWVETREGVRNVWTAEAPAFRPEPATAYTADDGQEITGLTFSPDGKTLLFVRGGDHDANWPAEGDLAPDPASSPDEPKVRIYLARPGEAPKFIAEGDDPAISAAGVLAFVKNHQIWTAPLDGSGEPERLLFDRGHDEAPAWSPDGSRLAFVSARGDHAFVAVWSGAGAPLVYLQPSTGIDGDFAWSPDGRRIAFTRRPGRGGPPRPILTREVEPWSILTADARTGAGAVVWRSPKTFDGSYPRVPGGVTLSWAGGGRLVFRAELDGWPHLWSLSLEAPGAAPTLLTPGAYMVEGLTVSPDGRRLAFSANTGRDPRDLDRRHVFDSPADRPEPRAATSGDGLEWAPVFAGPGELAFISAGARRPAEVARASLDGGAMEAVNPSSVASYPADALVVPTPVAYRAPDGLLVHAQLFRGAGGGRKPAVIFVHGGPPRQMLLGWSYMDYYANAYAVNQYLAQHGFVVLSVNYRLGIGYGRAYQEPDHAGPAGASEYQDVLAGARYLQSLPDVDPARIGIWGGSYGGYLTGLALGRNSDVFKAGVDLHGVHDWSQDLAGDGLKPPVDRYEQGDWLQGLKTAFESSPDAAVDTWRSPVLLIQGDDDRNVRFSQTVDLARRLEARGVPFEELVLPNEIHGFLRGESWRKADAATVEFLTRELKPTGP